MTFKIDRGDNLHTSTEGVVFNPHVVSDKPGDWKPVSAIVAIEPLGNLAPDKYQPGMSIKVLDWRGPVYLNGKRLMPDSQPEPQPEPIPVRVATETRPVWEFRFHEGSAAIIVSYMGARWPDGRSSFTDPAALGKLMTCISLVKHVREQGTKAVDVSWVNANDNARITYRPRAYTWTIDKEDADESVTVHDEGSAVFCLYAAVMDSPDMWAKARDMDLPF